jgi:hypothetical protein
MLRMIEGGAGKAEPLRVEDLPLGPWAGQQVPAWATKSGTRWHADPDCSSLKTKARTEVFDQPAAGTLGQRQPTDLHCQPPGNLSDHLTAAQQLVRFAAATDEAEQVWGKGDILLSALRGRHGYLMDAAEQDALENGSLASIWARERQRRQQWEGQVDQQLAPAGERLSVMAMADWVRRGRTSREHQPRYDQFVRLGAGVLAAMGLTVRMGNGRYINSDCLPDWLDDVVSGRTCDNATAAMVEREYRHATQANLTEDNELPGRARDAWGDVGVRWQQALETMAWAHPGVVLALFGLYSTNVDHDLLDVCVRRGPAAQLRVGHLDWAVAVVPAAFRLGLAERDHGLGGLVLLEGPLYRVDQACCERFLRNLVRSLDHPELADRVTGPSDGAHQVVGGAERSDVEFEASLAVHQWGFGAEGWGDSVTTTRCAPALRADLCSGAILFGSTRARQVMKEALADHDGAGRTDGTGLLDDGQVMVHGPAAVSAWAAYS